MAPAPDRVVIARTTSKAQPAAAADEEVFVLTSWNSEGANEELTALDDATTAFESHHPHVSGRACRRR